MRPLQASARKEIWVDAQGEPISHFTHAVRFGELLFISGCAPIDAHNQLVGGDDAAAQARQVLTNIQQILEAAEMSFADILKVTVYLTDIGDRANINPVRQEFFGTARPASTLVEVSALAVPGMRVEIDAIAGRTL
jgi:2-iminobutanoate/2-iminopropanoate deaminase